MTSANEWLMVEKARQEMASMTRLYNIVDLKGCPAWF